jgi:transposase
MPRAGRPKVRQYSLEFKLKAVKLSQLPGVEVQAVADALEIHPFMLSRWRKEARDGVLRGRVALPKAVHVPPASQVKQRKHAILKEEHALLKNSSGSPPHESRRLCGHRRSTGTVRCDAAVPAVRRHAGGVLCVAASARECASEARPGTARRDACHLRGE